MIIGVEVLRRILDSGSYLRACFHAGPNPPAFAENCQQVRPTRPPSVQGCTLSVPGDGSDITPEDVVCITCTASSDVGSPLQYRFDGECLRCSQQPALLNCKSPLIKANFNTDN